MEGRFLVVDGNFEIRFYFGSRFGILFRRRFVEFKYYLNKVIVLLKLNNS